MTNEQREILMQEARLIAAQAYPECMGSMPDGTPMPNVCHRAILGGHYDRGTIVMDPFNALLAKLDEIPATLEVRQ